MKFFDKLGLAIFSLIVLVLSIILCLIGFGVMDSTIFTVLIGKVLMYQTYTNIMIGVCIALMLLAVKCIFFSGVDNTEESNDGILLQNSDGKLLITVDTLKNLVEGTVSEFKNIIDSNANVIITKDNDVIINISINVTKSTVIKDTTSKLQSKIKKEIKDATDLEVKAVNIQVIKAEDDGNNEVEEVAEIKEVKEKASKDKKEEKTVKDKKEEKVVKEKKEIKENK